MILIFALGVAIALAYLFGGRLSRLATLPLRGTGLALTAFALQVGVVYLIPPFGWQEQLRIILLTFSYLLLAVFILRNRRLPGMWALGVGLAANGVVILANGGHMPVTYEALVAAGKSAMVNGAESGAYIFGSKDILLPQQETRLWFLSDIFVIPPPFPFPNVFSLGDAIIAIGLLWFVPRALGAETHKQLTGSAPLS